MKMKWKMIIGMLLAVCLVMMTLPVMASDGNTEVNGTVPLIIYNVSSSGVSYNGAAIAWTTNGAATSQVFYDTASHQNIGDYVSHTSINNNPVSAHNVPLAGLTPNKTYYYRVESVATIGGTAVSDEYSFMTLPAPSTLTTITVTANPNPLTQTSLSTSSTVTVTAKDQNNNPMANIIINLGVSSPGIIAPTPVTTGSNGLANATLTLSSLVTQSTPVTVTASSSGVQGQTTVTFNPPAAKLSTMTIILNLSPEPSAYGQSVNINAVVLSTWFKGVPTGTVNYMEGTSLLGSSTLGNLGFTSFSIAILSPGKHIITAVYNGDNKFATSTSSAWSHTVNKAKTTTALTSSINPSVITQSVKFTATVNGAGGTPSGNVTFKDGGTVLSSNVALVGGSASIDINTLTVGSHNITANYSGDGNYNSSTSNTVKQTVNKISTSIVLSSGTNPSVSGQSVKFTATLSPTAATGSITFKDGNSTLGTGILSGGIATYNTTLAVGTHNITAVYAGNSTYAASTSNTITQAVVAKPVIKTTSLPGGTNNKSYSQTLSVSGGAAPFTWAITGSLPPGLSLNASTGAISGKPTATGTFSFTVKVTDSLGNTVTQGLSIKINN